MNIHENAPALAKALGKSNKKITAVSYEYPGFWLIETKTATYYLGDVNEFISWHSEDGTLAGHLEGSSMYTEPLEIAKAFSTWLDNLDNMEQVKGGANWGDVVAYNRFCENLKLVDTTRLCEIVEIADPSELKSALEEFIAERGFDENAIEHAGFWEWLENKENN